MYRCGIGQGRIRLAGHNIKRDVPSFMTACFCHLLIYIHTQGVLCQVHATSPWFMRGKPDRFAWHCIMQCNARCCRHVLLVCCIRHTLSVNDEKPNCFHKTLWLSMLMIAAFCIITMCKASSLLDVVSTPLLVHSQHLPHQEKFGGYLHPRS